MSNFLVKLICLFIPTISLRKKFKRKFLITKIKTSNGLKVIKHVDFIDIINGKKCVRISCKHDIYLGDVINCFEYYYSAVKPSIINGLSVVDYSVSKLHDVNGFNLQRIMFPSFAEPITTANQYLEFAQLNKDSIVLDLGAYSGLTSILFDQQIISQEKDGKGKVIAVDPDINNSVCIKSNLELYKKITGRQIDFLQVAVWKDNNGIGFSSEGNMGSSATSIVGVQRGTIIKVQTLTLNDIAQKYELPSVDFIKCDIEGAEQFIFNDNEFFKKYKPKIIVEAHCITPKDISTHYVIECLSKYNYNCKIIEQTGVTLPLIECLPKDC